MALAAGSHTLGPRNASLLVRTYREGVAARAGHDLVIEVTRWDATVEFAADPAGTSIELSADSRSLEVREGLRGVKPLTDRDRAEIGRNIDDKVLHGHPISFRSTGVRQLEGALLVDGELAVAERARPVSVRLDVDADGHVSGTIALTQSDWGIKPYRGLMGALKVRDEVEVAIDARLPTA
jgi:polyisoprenoid-binding protein YceI